MTLKTIRLALARDKEFPDGATNRGYIFKAPLTADGSLDKESWSKGKSNVPLNGFGQVNPMRQGTSCIRVVMPGFFIMIP